MRRLMLVQLGCCLWLALPIAASAQPADPASAPQAPAASAAADESRSLFDQTWHQFQFGGRATSIDGDPARFQRYQDVRDGVLFTDAKYAAHDPDGNWLYRVTADNVGYRDQRFTGVYERTGRFAVSGMWDEIPQFYSVDTKTAYTLTPSPLRLDDAMQQANQSGKHRYQ